MLDPCIDFPPDLSVKYIELNNLLTFLEDDIFIAYDDIPKYIDKINTHGWLFLKEKKPTQKVGFYLGTFEYYPKWIGGEEVRFDVYARHDLKAGEAVAFRNGAKYISVKSLLWEETRFEDVKQKIIASAEAFYEGDENV